MSGSAAVADYLPEQDWDYEFLGPRAHH